MHVFKNDLTKKPVFYLLISVVIALALFLRIWQLGSFPVSPYWEEVALGFDAYSILKTTADHHGNTFPIVAFESFGDWKPSGYFYALVPFIWLFDLSVFSIRLPTALAGVLLVVCTGYLSFYLQTHLSPKKGTYKVAAITGLLLAAVSPWLLLFSRGAWEVTLATTFLYLGFLSGLQVFSKKNISVLWLLSCVLLLVLSMYTYHATRIIAPLFGLILIGWWYTQDGIQTLMYHFQQKSNKKYLVLIAPVLLAVSLLPLAQSLGSSQITQRVAETSIFSDIEPILASNELKEFYSNAWWTSYLFHRYIFFASVIFDQALSHFTLDFLFITGDTNPRHSVQMVGQLYILETVAILTGAYILLRRNQKLFWLLLAMCAAIVLPSAISKAAPHALRTLPLAPLLLSVAAVGWIAIYEKAKQLFIPSLIVLPVILVAYVLFVTQFFHYYFVVYPKVQAHEWQYGYKQAVKIISEYSQANPDSLILLSSEYGRPLMYYWFYTKTDPSLVQNWSKSLAQSEKDQSELLSFQNLAVIRPGRDQDRLRSVLSKVPNKILIAGSEEYLQKVAGEIEIIDPQTPLNSTENTIQNTIISSPVQKLLWSFLELTM